MKNGKISEAILKRSVLKQIHNSNEKVLVDSKVGNDCGIIDISHSDAIGTASSIITLDIHNMNLLARIAIFGAVNNVSAMGNKALAVTVELIIPTSWNEVKLRELMGCLDSVCAEAGVSIISGHTQVSRAVNNCCCNFCYRGERFGKLHQTKWFKAWNGYNCNEVDWIRRNGDSGNGEGRRIKKPLCQAIYR